MTISKWFILSFISLYIISQNHIQAVEIQMFTIGSCDYWEGNIGYPSDLVNGCAVHRSCTGYTSTPGECHNNCYKDPNCRVAVYSSSDSQCYPKGYNRGNRQPADSSKTCYEKQYVGQ
eukprot:Pgem_evm1s14277